MNKVICDVCGTSYSETASQCPICGCVRPGDVHVITDSDVQPSESEGSGYTYVKGGRFSKSNVRKRMKIEQNRKNEEISGQDDGSSSGSRKDTALMIAVIALLLAIIAVVVYIVLHFFVPGGIKAPDPVDTTGQTTTVETTLTDETTAPTKLEIPCEELLAHTLEIQLDAADTTWQLDIQAKPENTTDEIVFASSDPGVVIVSADGLLTAVAEGSAEIQILCGDQELICEVVCSFPEETEPTQEETEPSEAVLLELNRDDFSMFSKGEIWDVYDGDIDPSLITWTSDNKAVVTVTDGVVEAVGPGDTKIHAEYNGQKVSCAVHCKFKNDTTQPVNPDNTPDNTTGDCNISATDVTLYLGHPTWSDSFVLTLKDAQGNPLTVTWQSTNSCCTITGNIIKAVSPGRTQIYTIYNGVKYSCEVYVQNYNG